MASLLVYSTASRVASGIAAACSGSEESITGRDSLRLPVSSRSLASKEQAVLASQFLGVRLSATSTSPVARSIISKTVQARATATIDAPVARSNKYELPTWANFELGRAPVFWETANGRAPASGEMLTVWYNPSASNVTPNPEYGIGFNGGFNSPIMCGGEPRQMTRKDRGPTCAPFYTIKINVPTHAMNIQFSFTDGSQWDGPFVLDLEVPAKWRNMPVSFFNERLAEELSVEGACDSAIFPEAAYIQDRCIMPAGLAHLEGASCELDLVSGCTDPESPQYNPFANIDDGSCPLDF